MHVPYLPEQVIELIKSVRAKHQIEIYQRQDLASMSMPVQLQAARIVLEELGATIGH
jgi:hypothetical protein